jgi:formamidopyrimidine-DNA glycosylase
MSGGWSLRKKLPSIPSKYTRIEFKFENAIVDFTDIRKFGKLDVYTTEEFYQEKIQSKFGSLGKDALVEEISLEYLAERIKEWKKKKEEIKPLLMEQSFLAGIGNIYASDICFLAGVNPFRKAVDLSMEELTMIAQSIPQVLKAAYENGGSTIRTYKDTNGNKGWTEHMVYGLKKCRLCKGSLSKGPQNGRTTYWCPKCQKLEDME